MSFDTRDLEIALYETMPEDCKDLLETATQEEIDELQKFCHAFAEKITYCANTNQKIDPLLITFDILKQYGASNIELLESVFTLPSIIENLDENHIVDLLNILTQEEQQTVCKCNDPCLYCYFKEHDKQQVIDVFHNFAGFDQEQHKN